MLYEMLRVIKTQWCCYHEKGLSNFMFEESFVPILLHANQTFSSKTCIKDILCQLMLYDAYKWNLQIVHRDIHRPNSIKSTYTFHPTLSKLEWLMKLWSNFSKIGHLRPCRHFLQLFAAQIGKKNLKKNHIITTKINQVQVFDNVWNHLCHFTLVYGNRLLDNNPFLLDQCYHYLCMLWISLTLQIPWLFLTFPNSAKKETPSWLSLTV